MIARVMAGFRRNPHQALCEQLQGNAPPSAWQATWVRGENCTLSWGGDIEQVAKAGKMSAFFISFTHAETQRRRTRCSVVFVRTFVKRRQVAHQHVLWASQR